MSLTMWSTSLPKHARCSQFMFDQGPEIEQDLLTATRVLEKPHILKKKPIIFHIL